MKYSAIKRYRRQQRGRGKAAPLLQNPIAAMGLDLPFLVVASVSVRSAVAMSVEMFLIHVITMVCAMWTCRNFSLWSRTAVNAGVATLVMVGARSLLILLFTGIINSLGMYVYLMAINGMTLLRAGTLSKNKKFLPVLAGSVLDVLAFSLICISVAVLREYLGNGTLWGASLPVPIKLNGLLLPFSGFILVGFLFALVHFIQKKWGVFMLYETARREANYTVIQGSGDEA